MKLNTRNLRDLFLDELADMYDAEHRITKALPKLIKAATCEDLQAALTTHLQETEGQITILQQVFSAFGEKPKSKKCEATVGLLKEGDSLVSDNKGMPTINAAIISAGQKVEHYEIASYGTLREWAHALGNQEAADLIQQILDQEKNADKTLGELAPAKNEEALQGSDEESSEVSSHSRRESEVKSGRKTNVVR
jgi:ferritin-like metal-binding protein YciE